MVLRGAELFTSAFISIASVIVVSCFSAETRFTPKSLYHTLELSSRNALMISTCSACAGIIVAIVSITGIGYKFISRISSNRMWNCPRSVMMLMPKTLIPQWRATITSGTVLIPTASPPNTRYMRYSAGVSKVGP